MSFDHAKPICNKVEERPGCIQAALRILGDKWSPLLLGQLVAGEKTFGELELMLGGISPRTLSDRLDTLIQEGIIQKNQYCKHPPRYRYQLTDKGKDLRTILTQMARWGEKYQHPVSRV
jgi:DNA-binding HxlR family transcriptional regulator